MIKEKANAPCKDCKNRHIGCHSECNEYKAFCESKTKEKANRRMENDLKCFQYSKRKYSDLRKKGIDK